MTPTSVQAVHARIAEITSRFPFGPTLIRSASPLSGPSFAAALAGAADSLGEPGMATPRPPGSYPRTVPPAALRRFGNGTIPPEALSRVAGTGHKLYEPAARSLERLLSAASAAGIRVGVTDSYRSIEVQRQVASEKGLYRDGGLAAVPGTSAHGWGLAVDLDLDSRAQAWMRANAHRFGFVEDTPREPWHWGYRPDGGV